MKKTRLIKRRLLQRRMRRLTQMKMRILVMMITMTKGTKSTVLKKMRRTKMRMTIRRLLQRRMERLMMMRLKCLMMRRGRKRRRTRMRTENKCGKITCVDRDFTSSLSFGLGNINNI
ncbi:unnamed protein product [Dibothriocephalus latus]|uniref:Uncharacterized protein n=1 Tax=Dibothriocephalus latus TaxID=60516 RepID=A0A3P6QDM8_DIBLA|nr:unnamed protein product [Dibothriocephalus latus]